jgi:deoxyadenosine/deoxycytidine kinase
MKLVAVEGPIAAGKSTLIKTLPEALNAATGEEWTSILEQCDLDMEFNRLLKQFLDHPTDANKRAEFQRYVTRSRFNLLKDLPDGNYVIERSLYSDLVFTQCNMMGTEGPTGEYQAAFYDIKEHMADYPPVDLVVYLSRDSEACIASAVERSRDGEDAYDLDYFEDLHRYHLTVLPQACRMYGADLHVVELGDSYPVPEAVAADIAGALQ